MRIWEKLFPPKKGGLLHPQERPYSLEEMDRTLKEAEAQLVDLKKQKGEIQQRIERSILPDTNRKNLERIEREIRGQEDKIALLKEKMRHEASK